MHISPDGSREEASEQVVQVKQVTRKTSATTLNPLTPNRLNMVAPVADRTYGMTEFILGDVPDHLKATSLDKMEASLVDIAERFERISTDPLAGQIPSVIRGVEHTTSVVAKFRWERAYHEKHPDRGIKGINFKDTNASTLDLVGLTLHVLCASATPTTATLLSTIKSNLAQREILETVENYWGDSLRVDSMIECLPFQLMVRSGGQLLSFSMVYELDKLYEELDLFFKVAHGPFTKEYEADNPAVIEYFTSGVASVQADGVAHEEATATQGEGQKKVYADRITCFTGALDFTRVYFAQEKGKEMRKGLEEKESNSYPEILDELLEEPIFTKLREEDDPSFMFVTEYNDTDLEQVLPSVLVKATLLADKFEKKQVTWCSTSGFDWMFGVLVTEGPTQARTAYRTDILTLDGLRGATSIFLSLAFWGMTPAQDILDLFSSASNELVQQPGEKN
ncbi:unnamed protein product [Cyclocybe aegerita]|uniref:Uncharacterized protein n=1 Tax=Cyclocybe aegerita TaxID=1973307 RepID=A0A8S0WTS1_CYCAE|nr:unnamed protein product [Cyclocybe aegerita]